MYQYTSSSETPVSSSHSHSHPQTYAKKQHRIWCWICKFDIHKEPRDGRLDHLAQCRERAVRDGRHNVLTHCPACRGAWFQQLGCRSDAQCLDHFNSACPMASQVVPPPAIATSTSTSSGRRFGPGSTLEHVNANAVRHLAASAGAFGLSHHSRPHSPASLASFSGTWPTRTSSGSAYSYSYSSSPSSGSSTSDYTGNSEYFTAPDSPQSPSSFVSDSTFAETDGSAGYQASGDAGSPPRHTHTLDTGRRPITKLTAAGWAAASNVAHHRALFAQANGHAHLPGHGYSTTTTRTPTSTGIVSSSHAGRFTPSTTGHHPGGAIHQPNAVRGLFRATTPNPISSSSVRPLNIPPRSMTPQLIPHHYEVFNHYFSPSPTGVQR